MSIPLPRTQNLVKAPVSSRLGPAVLLLALALAPAINLIAQPLTCSISSDAAPLVRVEGRAEPLADVVIGCSGGTGGEVQLRIDGFFNTNLTSAMPEGKSEVLALVNEPSPDDQALGVNMFRPDSARFDAPSQQPSFTFQALPVAEPSGGGARIIRITNLRADASLIGLSSTSLPARIMGYILISSPDGSPLASSQVILGTTARGLTTDVTTPDDDTSAGTVGITRCAGLNASLVDANTAIPDSATFNIKFSEGFAASFRPRQLLGDGGLAAAQNVPGTIYFTESMFHNPAWTGNDGFGQVGLASQGTRLMARFQDIPWGVSLFVTTTPSPVGTAPTLSSGIARLVAADPDGAGDFNPVAATTTVMINGQTVGLAPLQIQNGAATAVWEVVNDNGAVTDPAVLESLSFAVVVAFKPGLASAGQALLYPGFGPASSAGSDGFPVPRFRPQLATSGGFALLDCGDPAPDLSFSEVQLPPTVPAGTSGAATVTLRNLGSAAATAVHVKGSVYRDEALTDEVSSGGCDIASVGAHSLGSCSMDFALSAVLTPGRYHVKFIADPDNAIADGNRDNNSYQTTLDISHCLLSVSPVSVVVGAGGGSGSAIVSTTFQCYWDAQSDSDWLTKSVSSPSSLTYSAAPNSGATRTGIITVGYQPLTVIQAGASCSYSVSPASIHASPDAQNVNITVTTSSDCPWVAQSSSAFVSLPSSPPVPVIGSGSVSVALTVNSGVARSGSVTVAGQTIVISQDGLTVPPQLPSVHALNPVASSGSNQSFTFQFIAPNGWQDIGVVNMLINNYLDGRHACYVAYSRPSNTIYLVNDAGQAGGPYAGSMLLKGTSAISNSQCTIRASGSGVSGAGKTMTLTLNISFAAGFSGNKVVYLAARDKAENNSGWQTMGVFGVPPLPDARPQAIAMSPSSGVTSTGTLKFTFEDVTSAANLQTAWALINTAIDGRGACYVAYYRPGNQIYLFPDNGDGTQATSMVLKGTNTVSNSQCTVSAQGSTVTAVGKQLVVSLNIHFQPAFAGPKGVWMAVQTTGGAKTTGWQALGAWNVPGI